MQTISNTVASLLASSMELHKNFFLVYQYLANHLPIDGIYINAFRPEDKEIEQLVSADQHQGREHTDRIALPEHLCRTLTEGERPKVRIVQSLEQDPVTDQVLSKLFPTAASCILLRLYCGEQHLGVVGFYANRPNAFTTRHQQLVEPLQPSFSIAAAYYQERRRRYDGNRRPTLLLEETAANKRHPGVVGAGSGLAAVMKKVEAVARLDSTVMLLGETGVGKEIIADAVHHDSHRRGKPMVKVNCGSIPESLIDSELFGHVKGAFTGADSARAGYFEQANGGTIFLDEIGELPLQVQARLLRVLQSRSVTRVGGSEVLPLDIRVIVATHRDLSAMVSEKAFREDLFYRLNVYPITIPPLRERRHDIALLVQHRIEVLASENHLDKLPILPASECQRVMDHQWRGNVRELFNAVERAFIESGGKVLSFHFLAGSSETTTVCPHEQATMAIVPNQAEYQDDITLNDVIRDYIERVLERVNGKIQGPDGAAEKLGLHPNTLRSKMAKLGIR